MTVHLRKAKAGEIPIRVVDRASHPAQLAQAGERERRWLTAVGFNGAPDTHALVPDESGRPCAVWAGVRAADHPWALAALPRALPAGRYRLHEQGLAVDAQAAAFSWTLGGYAYGRYKARSLPGAELSLPPAAGAQRGLLLADAVARVRDWVTTPAEDMGPEHLAEVTREIGRAHGARFRQVVGDDLLKRNFPAIHAVGRAATRAPRLIELNWGAPKDPLVTLVGKGVCFDSGGLDIKGADGMRWMKKDMGGAATALGLAQAVMAAKLPVRLQLLMPAVENAIAGNAYRPGDVIRTRRGLHVEIGNTDAEGRVILCDALAYGAERQPALMIDLATLTGAARVALGGQLPALFTRRMALARELVDQGLALHDPVWHLPLWADYHGSIESDIADIVNTGRGGQAGAITAALFLADFVPDALDWLHLDLYAWNDGARPGRPVGGEAQALRLLLAYLERRFGAGSA
ncbi:MAG: leucyl aminopeptidase family protein [Aquabacterium sp.]